MPCLAKTLNIEKAKQKHRLRREAQVFLGVQLVCMILSKIELEKVGFGKSGDTDC